MILLILTVFTLSLSLCMAAMCALSDFRGLRIPNNYIVAVLGLFFVMQVLAFVSDDVANILPSLTSAALAGVIIFVISAVMFALKLMGAGDSKMMSAYALTFGTSVIPAFLFYMAVSGALLGIFTLLLGKYKPFKKFRKDGWIDFAQQGKKNKVPYGIAIFIGVFMAYFEKGYFSPDTYILLLQ